MTQKKRNMYSNSPWSKEKGIAWLSKKGFFSMSYLLPVVHVFKVSECLSHTEIMGKIVLFQLLPTHTQHIALVVQTHFSTQQFISLPHRPSLSVSYPLFMIADTVPASHHPHHHYHAPYSNSDSHPPSQNSSNRQYSNEPPPLP